MRQVLGPMNQNVTLTVPPGHTDLTHRLTEILDKLSQSGLLDPELFSGVNISNWNRVLEAALSNEWDGLVEM